MSTKTDDLATFAALLEQVKGGKGTTLGADDDILYHDKPSIVVPEGMSMEKLSEVALKKARELNEMHTFTHQTDYRPEDGAHAAAQVIKSMFGLTIGKATMTMFGPKPPEFRSIKIAHNKSMEVPWGELEIPALPGASFEFGGVGSKRGPVFIVQVTSPKKHKVKIEAFFAALDVELSINSIYRGKALMGAHELDFMNVTRFKSSQIVFADHVQRTLDAAIFGLIDHTDATAAAGMSTKRSVLAFGPFGTGKTSLAMIVAQRAEKAGWTFLSARAGKDNIKDVMDTAALYEPAVVFVEDIDVHTPAAKNKTAVSELLDVFDGVGSKDSKLLVVMTTNHIDQVPAGMLRPGRLDYTVEINGLDRLGVERLVKAVVRKDLLAGDVDYDAVFEPMAEWQPAWVKAATERAQSFALARSGGQLDYRITTDDLVDAANSLLPQLALMNSALEGYHEPDLNTALDTHVQAAVKSAVGEGFAFVDEPESTYPRFWLKDVSAAKR
jgi:ATP-dependent 26S proteasome regulatory subunit